MAFGSLLAAVTSQCVGKEGETSLPFPWLGEEAQPHPAYMLLHARLVAVNPEIPMGSGCALEPTPCVLPSVSMFLPFPGLALSPAAGIWIIPDPSILATPWAGSLLPLRSAAPAFLS